MLYANGNSVLLDQYNLWVQSPEVMLNRYMLNAMDCKGKRSGERFDLSVSIFEFSISSNISLVFDEDVSMVFSSTDQV